MKLNLKVYWKTVYKLCFKDDSLILLKETPYFDDSLYQSIFL